jgi:acyl carrier protein
MDANKVLDAIRELTLRHCEERGLAKITVDEGTVLLGDSTGLDSLDLATLIFELQQITGDDPFTEGFINFATAGDLAYLFAGSASGAERPAEGVPETAGVA